MPRFVWRWGITLNRLHNSLTGAPLFGDEFAESTFSPDGHKLFVNIKASRGTSFAICGPWNRIGAGGQVTPQG